MEKNFDFSNRLIDVNHFLKKHFCFVYSYCNDNVDFLYQPTKAKLIDLALFEFISVETLVELAALACVSAIKKVYSTNTHPRILAIAGPGNNGADTLVASRHLKQSGYNIEIFYPKRNKKEMFQNYVEQNVQYEVPFLEQLPQQIESNYDLIIDGLFGFSFQPPIRKPFDTIINKIKHISENVPVVSIDIGSEQDVEKGNLNNLEIETETLISLTLPKEGSKFFTGKHHFLGGNFLTKSLAKRFDVNIPQFPHGEMVIKLK
ncbi:nad(p)h-hydrate epimerase [Anaeramoeba flamelloides]|uniref:NAD(P)H-hydrate epimerase n=1 Tax=Anaeramoeba flamelloides TaxID=1746091 RepID=A0AAV7YPU6_9EUKA|nr:nad(p)h-hydrate epimerase [Anaeramoeba flamelloides]